MCQSFDGLQGDYNHRLQIRLLRLGNVPLAYTNTTMSVEFNFFPRCRQGAETARSVY
jgi:hypothetical protein